VVRGATVDNPIMCALNAQAMIARTDLVRGDGSEYMKVVCTPSWNADEWVAEVEGKAAFGPPLRDSPSLSLPKRSRSSDLAGPGTAEHASASSFDQLARSIVPSSPAPMSSGRGTF
jgi:hypothetical protein